VDITARGEMGKREISPLFHELEELLVCPESCLPLRVENNEFLVEGSGRRYAVTDGVPCLLSPNTESFDDTDVTGLVRQFYENNPFPNYDELDSRESLERKARKSMFSAMLDAEIPKGAIVLEAGCGTGQMTNFLGMSWKRRILGADICLNSLRLAEAFRQRCSIQNAAFLQMNLFRPPFRDESFDVIIANGVLHHTSNPEGGLAALSKKLKPGGIVCIGLYNTYARLPAVWRRWLFNQFGGSLYFLDRFLRSRRSNAARFRAWYMDQYRHPHESRHSMDQVLGWFSRNRIEFLSGMPPLDGSALTRKDKFFERHSAGSTVTRKAAQIDMLLSGGFESGLFIMTGRKCK